MLGTSMPKAPVHERGDSRSREDKIRAHAYQSNPDRIVLSEPEAEPMCRGPEPHLRHGVASAIRTRDSSSGLRDGLRVGHLDPTGQANGTHAIRLASVVSAALSQPDLAV